MTKVLVIDPKIAGISGDMFISSLIALTGSYELVDMVAHELNQLKCCNSFSVAVLDEKVNGISSKELEIQIDSDTIENPDELKDTIINISKNLKMREKSIKLCENIINDLIFAEKKLHGDKFHLHEISSIDTVFDIVCSILILERNGYLDGKIYSTCPSIGNGRIKMAHGIIPSPAPATLEILCKYNIKCSKLDLEYELLTPTGIAILSNITDEFLDSYPEIIFLKTGYGSGKRRMGDFPNVLRIIEGKTDEKIIEKTIMLETNIDDISAEIISYATERLLNEGASDVFITPTFGKKNRHGTMISVICPYTNFEKFVKIIMEETGTLGVRINHYDKIRAKRKSEKVFITLNNCKFEFDVKISELNGNIINIKPEFEDLKKIAKKLNIPLREVLKYANIEINKTYGF
ncbi:protein of unknown function DUF111 [Methanococcus vannielii SB]|uniref:Nickel insertion protein n=1 Tax=Methanococcus vannielii (strain ATCC 35089 / DSM 1224 / JCM 13029 / OCM 148 / SB) TaxID=406327 RepID=A6URQ6_METVS|nr:nickel pincer cofactor biosynthesis protein LarC [Methanococcus vannielii]ABR55178.1 protein of unknown function DUF111 [Methanococcus vannielii SB]